MDELDTLRAGNSADARATLARADLLVRTGRAEEALESYKRALRADPYNPKTYYAIATLLERSGKSADACDYYRGFLNQASRSSAGLESMIDCARERLKTLGGE